MPKPPAARTLTDAVHDRLRADILAGSFRPGARLKFADLQRRYAASVAVLREALIRLEGAGLVRSAPQVGFTVTPLSRAALVELTDARVVLETAVFGLAVAYGDTGWEAGALAGHHVLTRTPVRPPGEPHRISEEWAAAHLAFHRALLAGCPNRRLRDLADSLRVAAELYRAWSQTIGAEPDRDVHAEHRDLLGAALDRDADAGTALLAAHIRRTAANLLAAAADEGDDGPATSMAPTDHAWLPFMRAVAVSP